MFVCSLACFAACLSLCLMCAVYTVHVLAITSLIVRFSVLFDFVVNLCTKLIKFDRSEKNKVTLRNVSLGVRRLFSARHTGCVRMIMMKCMAFLSTFQVFFCFVLWIRSIAIWLNDFTCAALAKRSLTSMTIFCQYFFSWHFSIVTPRRDDEKTEPSERTWSGYWLINLLAQQFKRVMNKKLIVQTCSSNVQSASQAELSSAISRWCVLR